MPSCTLPIPSLGRMYSEHRSVPALAPCNGIFTDIARVRPAVRQFRAFWAFRRHHGAEHDGALSVGVSATTARDMGITPIQKREPVFPFRPIEWKRWVAIAPVCTQLDAGKTPRRIPMPRGRNRTRRNNRTAWRVSARVTPRQIVIRSLERGRCRAAWS